MPVRRPTSLRPVSPLSLRSSGPISSWSLCCSITSPPSYQCSNHRMLLHSCPIPVELLFQFCKHLSII